MNLYIALEVDNLSEIQQLRFRFDSLANKVPPHITLVFPTEVVEVDLKKLRTIAEATQPIEVQLVGPTGTQDNLLFLTLLQGNDPVFELHRRLYRELFPDSYDRTYSYLPHITVGRFNKQQEMLCAIHDTPLIAPIFVRLDTMIIVEICNNGDRKILETFALRGRNNELSD